ncbi:NAD-dependent dihydropyrimidine dehydrogenase subunit PreT [hydrothermal vent metagenome]|uniref:NAD-dependent dihydropyrimidine dehydrogenase subunit PreT n=1 Tax=hydrothermal vent metagenome TaxID=652676 RepID=A0A3B1B3H2_9ZZZZ
MNHKNHRAAHNKILAKQDANSFFDELHRPLNKSMALKEADHCLYCYDAPCIQACPTSIDIPTFIHQIKSGNVIGAAHTILKQNIMGGTCARACPTEVLCEQACVLNDDASKPVEIGLLQRFAADHLMAKSGPHPFKRAAETGRTIAVIGAGPAGLSFAHRAAVLGHDIHIYEARDKAGGLNEYGLAAYKMVDDFAAKEVDFILDIGGIDIFYGTSLGQDLPLNDLQDKYDAIFIGVGLGSTNDLGLDGEDMSGITDAIDFIEDLRQTDDLSSLELGQNIIVIGGGNTAIDAAIQAKKLGSPNVALVYRRGESQMGATDFEVELARKNGISVHLWSKPITLHGKNNITAITFEHTALRAGKLVGTGEAYILDCDMLLKAIGQKLDGANLQGLATKGGKLVISESYQTSNNKIFAGGDCVLTGEDLTVQAVEDGKQAAIAMDIWLRDN